VKDFSERQKSRSVLARAMTEARAAAGAQEPGRKVLVHDLRAAFHAASLAEGATPALMNRLCSRESPLREAQALLDQAKANLGAERTIMDDTEFIKDQVFTRIAEAAAAPYFYFALAIDGASFKHIGAYAVMLTSNSLSAPVLLGLLVHEGDGPYTADLMGDDVLALLARYNITSLEHCACLIGDNVFFNRALARKLGLLLGKCLPHSLNLLAAGGLDVFKIVWPGVVALGGFVDRGGSSRHRKTLAAHGLNADAIKVYPNRFASTIKVCVYVESRFTDVQAWVMTKLRCDERVGGRGRQLAAPQPAPQPRGAALPARIYAAEAEDADDSSGEDDDDGAAAGGDGQGKAAKSSYTRDSVVKAYQNPELPVVLRVVQQMYGRVPGLIATCSSDASADLPRALAALDDLRRRLEDYAAVENARTVRST
jgi:hypothetical protein